MDVICYVIRLFCLFFFFQAEDGIRDTSVTGVQTCALPILEEMRDARGAMTYPRVAHRTVRPRPACRVAGQLPGGEPPFDVPERAGSEVERRGDAEVAVAPRKARGLGRGAGPRAVREPGSGAGGQALPE